MLWLHRVIIVLVVLLIGVALFGLFHLTAWLFFRFYRGRCPKCGERGLRMIEAATRARIDGERVPSWWKVYFQCEKCGVALLWRGDKWEEVEMDDPSIH